MMSAHDVAIAALNEVATHLHSEPRVGEFAASRSVDFAATSIETSKNATSADARDSNALVSFQSSSSNNSQTTVPEATTPPTSDEFSSQSQKSPSQFSQKSQVAALGPSIPRVGDATLSAPPIASNAGQKRTIDGYVKTARSNSNSSASPPTDSLHGHSRQISSASSNVNSRELVSELRTRLSYALVKVNKGWEDLPLNEVESRTSQAGSPTSSTSTVQGRHNVITSPRAAIASLQNNPRSASHYANVAPMSISHTDNVTSPDSQPSRTYESFWREQSHRSGSVTATVGLTVSTNLSLAPPAEITSAARQTSNPRRSETRRFSKPPALLGQSTSDLSRNRQLSVGAQSPPPRTPNRTSHPVDAMLQTTNHKSLQERDAIETLLFMSSPGNSGNMGHAFPPQGQTSQQPSPLRGEFGVPLAGAQGRNVDFTLVRSNMSSETGSLTPIVFGEQRISVSQRGEDDAYDIMLDRIPDTDSSDDEIEIPISPRRLAAGRV